MEGFSNPALFCWEEMPLYIFMMITAYDNLGMASSLQLHERWAAWMRGGIGIFLFFFRRDQKMEGSHEAQQNGKKHRKMFCSPCKTRYMILSTLVLLKISKNSGPHPPFLFFSRKDFDWPFVPPRPPSSSCFLLLTPFISIVFHYEEAKRSESRRDEGRTRVVVGDWR